MIWNVYLSGEIHTNWRNEIKSKSKGLKLPIEFFEPTTDHDLSDNCGKKILGEEKSIFWKDHKSAKLNSIRTRTAIENSDIVIVRFGEKYRQWNAAFDAGFAAALSKPIIIIHSDDNQHALKEIDAAALVVTKNIEEAIHALKYVTLGKL